MRRACKRARIRIYRWQIVIDESGVRMESSTCKNQICVHHSTIDPHAVDDLLLDRWIVCLPNAVSVEVSGPEDGQ